MVATGSRRRLLTGLLAFTFFGVLRRGSRLVDGVDLAGSVDWKRRKSRVGAELLQQVREYASKNMRRVKNYIAKKG